MSKPASPDWENLTTEQYFDIATGHDIGAWQAQQEAFAVMRDLCDEVAQEARRELDRLKEIWSGHAAVMWEAQFTRLLSGVDALRASAASNSDGMREMTAAMRELAAEARLLRSEDQEWQRNPDDDDRDTVRRLRDSLRTELRDKIIESDEQFQQLSDSYLLPPPQAPEAGGLTGPPQSPGAQPAPRQPAPAQTEQPPHTEDPRQTAQPRLQSAPQAAPAPVEPTPQPQQAPPPADTPTPMMPMGGEAMGAGGSAGGGAGARSGGPTFDETKQPARSRMRSSASRQELLNQERYGQYHRADPQRQRRVAGAEEDSPFASDATVVPPVVSGGTPPVGPHDSGPVVTGTVYRYFPEYGLEAEPQQFEETFDDGARAEVNVPTKDKDTVSRLTSGGRESTKAEQATTEPQAQRSDDADAQQHLQTADHAPGDQAAAFATAQRRLRDQAEPVDAPAPQADEDARVRRATDSQESLADQRRRRREAREERRQAMRGDEDE